MGLVVNSVTCFDAQITGIGGVLADESQPPLECEGGQELAQEQGLSQDLWLHPVTVAARNPKAVRGQSHERQRPLSGRFGRSRMMFVVA